VALTARLVAGPTAQDLVEERDALQQDASPRLRDLCRDRGVRLQVVDLRWSREWSAVTTGSARRRVHGGQGRISDSREERCAPS
jgi:hypothetical protein